MKDTPLYTPTSGDITKSLRTIEQALERLTLSDDDSDNLNTAMAWVYEELDLDRSDTFVHDT